jgi:hypothetical protein
LTHRFRLAWSRLKNYQSELATPTIPALRLPDTEKVDAISGNPHAAPGKTVGGRRLAQNLLDMDESPAQIRPSLGAMLSENTYASRSSQAMTPSRESRR